MIYPNSDTNPETDDTPITPRRKVPRLASLFHRLGRARDAKGKPAPYLDELMLFLDDPPPGTLDRWKQGAKMCRGWGFETTGSSVYRLYNSYLALWRMEMAEEALPDTDDLPAYRERAVRLTALRTVEALGQSRLAPAHLIGLARLEVRRQSLELAREKFKLAYSAKLKMGLDALAEEIDRYPTARAAFETMRAEITKKDEDNDDSESEQTPPDSTGSPTPKPPLHPPHPPDAPIYPRSPRPPRSPSCSHARVLGNALVGEAGLPPPAKPAG